MFAQIHLWEFGILLIGIAFVVGAIFLGRTLKNISMTIEDIDQILESNKHNIESIMSDIENITRSTSEVMDDVQQSVGSLKQSIYNAEKTVSSTKNYVLKPVYKSLNYAHMIFKIINRLFKKKQNN